MRSSQIKLTSLEADALICAGEEIMAGPMPEYIWNPNHAVALRTGVDKIKAALRGGPKQPAKEGR